MEQAQKKFGLLTTISMIVGIVIGSGIFFKTDDVLLATGGNVFLGVLTWIVASFGIIFGGLCVAQYARKNDAVGGLITYCEDAWGKTFGYLAGWFQVIFYFPALVAILSWVGAMYTGLVFGISDPFTLPIWIMAIVILLSFFLINVFHTKKAAYFQQVTMMIKIAALLILAVIGILFGSLTNLQVSVSPITTSTGLFSGIIACAFAFDGWFIAPSIAHEIKNPKKNLSLALVVAPIVILLIYVLYFVGINMILGPEQVLALGDASVGYILSQFFGSTGSRLVYIAVTLSVYGTINGIVLGYIRLPYSLAVRQEIFSHQTLAQLHPSLDIPIASAVFSCIASMIWLGLHYLSTIGFTIGFINFSNLEVDNLPITLTYIFYSALYIRLLLYGVRDRFKHPLQHLIFPTFALIGASLVLYGSISHGSGWKYMLISLCGILLGILVRPKKQYKMANSLYSKK